MTTRRSTSSALALLCATPRMLAQVPPATRPKRIGFLSQGSDPKRPETQSRIRLALAKFGWSQDNLVIDRAYAEWNNELLSELAHTLIRKRVDVIFCDGGPATIAAARATRTIPVLFMNAAYPLEQGLIESYARPGGNVTGQALSTGMELSTKRLQFLRELVPSAKRLSWLWADSLKDETLSGGTFHIDSVAREAAHGLGFELRLHPIRSPHDIDTAFRELTSWRAQALSAGGQQVLTAAQRVATLALAHRLPSAFADSQLVEAGGLLSYSVPESEWEVMDLRFYEYLDRILRGAAPADLPVERPSRFELLINIKTAKALGLTVPKPLLLRADRLVQ